MLPFSYHHITVTSIDDDARVVASDEHGGVIRTWRHDVTVTPIDETACRYDDRIDIDAGDPDPAVVAGGWKSRWVASASTCHRQHRW